MKRNYIGILLLLVMIFGVACTNDVPPGRTAEGDIVDVTEPFSLDEAQALIDETEWLVAWLAEKQQTGVITREEGDWFEERITSLDVTKMDAYHDEFDDLYAVADVIHSSDDEWFEMDLRKDYIEPTIYHEGVSLTDAEIRRYCELDTETGECVFHQEFLTIKKGYNGPVAAMQDWESSYVLGRVEHDGDWYIYTRAGSYVVENITEWKWSLVGSFHVELDGEQLPLSDAYYQSEYRNEE